MDADLEGPLPGVDPAFFHATGAGDREVLHPEPSASSAWTAGSTLRGMAISSVMARAAERALAAEPAGLRPARWTADLSRPVPARAVATRARVLRSGRRVQLVEVELVEDDQVWARARGMFLRPGGLTAGSTWAPEPSPLTAPPPELEPVDADGRLHWSDGVGWTADAAAHRGVRRKAIWHRELVVVAGEEPTPFQLAAAVADLANAVTNWGDARLAWVNADLTASFARAPRSRELGVLAHDRLEDDGIAQGVAVLHDVEGPFGFVTVAALANGDRAVDPAAREVAPPG